ncbi:hypothetical protein Cpir12675_006333 [Ceratocystis pirilliformis]|uniref:Chromatin structure-remodeling complex subunit rsc7 n=1 Tax=Ceratocystis pirilliformis TaxID=259994 RepID=A0ABR3YIB0_9PEZI
MEPQPQPQPRFHSSSNLQLPTQYQRPSQTQNQLQLLLQPNFQFHPQTQPPLQLHPQSQSHQTPQESRQIQQRQICQSHQTRKTRPVQQAQHDIQGQQTAQTHRQLRRLSQSHSQTQTQQGIHSFDDTQEEASRIADDPIDPSMMDQSSLSNKAVAPERDSMPSLKRARSPEPDIGYHHQPPVAPGRDDEAGTPVLRDANLKPTKRMRTVARTWSGASTATTPVSATDVAGASSIATSNPSAAMPMPMPVSMPVSISNTIHTSTPTSISTSNPASVSGCAPLSAIVSTPTLETTDIYQTYQNMPSLPALYPQPISGRMAMAQQQQSMQYLPSSYMAPRLPPMPQSHVSLPPPQHVQHAGNNGSTKPPKPPVVKSLPTVRDHTTSDVCESGDEYLPREIDAAGEQKVRLNGELTGGRKYLCKTFHLPHRADKLFMLATECARVLGYRDSYLLFNKNRSLFKMIANSIEKEELVRLSIIPYSYRSRQIAIVSARSMFRQFGSRVIVDGHRVRDDYWEAKAIKQGFTEEELSSDKRPGAAKARALAAATAVAEAAAAQAAVDQQHALLQGGHHDLSYGQYHGSAPHYMQPVLPMPPGNNYYDHQVLATSIPQEYSDSRAHRQELGSHSYDQAQSLSIDYSSQNHASELNRPASQREMRNGYTSDMWRRSHDQSHSTVPQPPSAIESGQASISSSTTRYSPHPSYGVYNTAPSASASTPTTASITTQSPSSMMTSSPYAYSIHTQAPTASTAMRGSVPALVTSQSYSYPPPASSQVWQQTVPQTPQSSYSGYTTNQTSPSQGQNPDNQQQQQQYQSSMSPVSNRLPSNMPMSSVSTMNQPYSNHSIYPSDQTPRQYLPPVSQTSSTQNWPTQPSQPIQSGRASTASQPQWWSGHHQQQQQ